MKKAAEKRPAGRPKDPGKRTALIRAAARLFTCRGYGETSIEQVAQEAGVSKLTVYSHFEGKEHLFTEVIESKCEEHFGGRDLTRFADRPPGEALPEIARRFLDLLMNDEVIAMHRMLLGSANSRDSVGRVANFMFSPFGSGNSEDNDGEYLPADYRRLVVTPEGDQVNDHGVHHQLHAH